MNGISDFPTWEDEVSALFSQPYWLPTPEQTRIGQNWQACMKQYLIDLSDRDSVAEWAPTIYNHLASRNMPLTTDARQLWPAEALETLRRWINQGCRRSRDDPLDISERIAAPSPAASMPRLRRDIRALDPAEIDEFRARLDDVMLVGDPDPSSPWQRWAYLHTNWCLHYQEAFAFWHRGFLLYLEALIDYPIPYWDWMAAQSSRDGSPSAGLPQPYLDEVYVHPRSRQTRRNPLRYAAAKDGTSKACQRGGDAAGGRCADACRWVHRDPLFLTSGTECEDRRAKHIAMVQLFQQQVLEALEFDCFSAPQGEWGALGIPWANIPVFDPPQPDALYPLRQINFDGCYEQPHDNFHGWIGADMADNAFTAFDPIFLSFHANIDRMLEVWIRAHPAAQFTTQTPLQPFVGTGASGIDEATPERWRYTTIGEMAQDSRRIGYDYGPPVAPQYEGRPSNARSETRRTQAAGDVSMAGPWIVFDGVRCTHDSYFIDVFLDAPAATADNAGPATPNYVGRFTRIGMGLADDKDRCIRHGVSRVLNARDAAIAVSATRDWPPSVDLVVTHLDTGRTLGRDEYVTLPGFVPVLAWEDPRMATPAETVSCGCPAPRSQGPEPEMQ